MHAAAVTGMAPEPRAADKIENRAGIERDDDPGIVRPGQRSEPVRNIAMGCSRTMHQDYQQNGQHGGHRRHGSSNKPASPCSRITTANNTPAATPMPDSRWRG